MVFDTIVRGGTVFDGSSSAQAGAVIDIGIKDGRIAATGNLLGSTASEVYEARGLVVSPGFIDIHTHSDISLGYNPGQASSISMGVTTQVVGNCGLSMGLATDSDTFSFEKRWLAPHRARITWDNFDEYLRNVEAKGSGNNIVPLAGHGTLRKRITGDADRAVTSDELAEMAACLRETMESGAWGISSGLEYPPSSYANVEELTSLCRVVAEFGGLYATHLRNEGDTLIESVQEALQVAEASGAPLQLSHHKAEGRNNWGKINKTLAMVEAARERGLDVQTDQYPYTAFMTSLSIQVLPRRALTGSPDDVSARLKDNEYRAQVRAEIIADRPEFGDTGEQSPWRQMQLGVCRPRPAAQGSVIADIAAREGVHPLDWVLDLLSESGYISAVNFAICEEDIAAVLRYPWTSIGSDGSGSDPSGSTGKDQIHPRTYGTFPRVLGHYVRELGVLTLSEAIHKMTALPARRMGLTHRGMIAPGYIADLTLFNPDTVCDLATFDTPHRLASGIEAVLVNGSFALKYGELTKRLAGKVVRKNRTFGE